MEIYKNPNCRKIRGSHILEVVCAHCKCFIANYQKVGESNFVKMYNDRIIDGCVDFSQYHGAVFCPGCGERVATQYITKMDKKKRIGSFRPLSTRGRCSDMRDEISKVMELTGAAPEQIKLHNDGYWSRAYVVNGGEFVVKLPKYDTVSYENEAKFLRLLGSASHAVNTQRLKWLAEDKRCIVLFGVKGTPISNLTLSALQKKRIGEQIGGFLKELHTLKPDFDGQNLDAELLEYRKIYDECADFYLKYFTKEEQKALDNLMYDYLPSARQDLGEKLVFSHADIWEPNILLDDNGKAGIIDCGNAGYFEEAADFVVEDEALRGFILDGYGAGEALRKKSEIKYDMSTITCPKFGIPLWGEQVIVDKWVPLIRKVITKYSKKV